MILTCPACTMRYLVSEGAVGPGGRRVRCAHCGHQWFQEPETGLDEALFGADDADDQFDTVSAPDDDEVPFERPSVYDAPDAADETATDFHSILQKEIEGAPIPEGVKPVHIHEDIALPGRSSKMRALRLPSEKLGGYATAAIVWAILLGVFMLLQPQISRAWPASNLVYALVGLQPVPPGEGLSLDNLRAEMGEGRIRMSGEILNLKEKDINLPSVMASIVNVDGREIDRILIAPPVARLKAEGRVSFDTVYPKIPDGAVNVNYAFSFVKAKPERNTPEETSVEQGTPPTELKPEDDRHEAPQHPAPHH